MITQQDISMEYIHAIADVLLELTSDNAKINTLVSLIYKESEPRIYKEENKQ